MKKTDCLIKVKNEEKLGTSFTQTSFGAASSKPSHRKTVIKNVNNRHSSFSFTNGETLDLNNIETEEAFVEK